MFAPADHDRHHDYHHDHQQDDDYECEGGHQHDDEDDNGEGSSNLAAFGLKPWCNICRQSPILTLDCPDLDLQSRCVGLASVGGEQKVPLLRGAGGVAHHSRVFLDIKEVYRDVALKEHVVNCCLALQAEHVGGISLVERHVVRD